MSDVNNSIAAALASLTTALTALAIETARSRGFASALEDRIAALEAKAATPVITPTLTVLKGREIRDGQW